MQETFYNSTLIFKWTLVWSLPGGQIHYLQENRQRPSTQPQLRHRDFWGLDTFTQGQIYIGHLSASYSKRSDSYQRPQAQCPRAELQSWGVDMMKGWVGLGTRDNKWRADHSTVKGWPWLQCIESSRCLHIQYKAQEMRFPVLKPSSPDVMKRPCA